MRRLIRQGSTLADGIRDATEQCHQRDRELAELKEELVLAVSEVR